MGLSCAEKLVLLLDSLLDLPAGGGGDARFIVTVQMRGKPVIRAQGFHQLIERACAEVVFLHVRFEEGFVFIELSKVSTLGSGSGPLVTQKYIDAFRQLAIHFELGYFISSNMENRVDIVP